MDDAPQPGRVFDHYRLLEKLGEGGMGVVWLAEDTRLGRKVALKFLPPEAARDAARRQRFEQEARAAAALSHPGIATVYELAEAEGQTFIAIEYVPGSTLRRSVAPGGLPPEELLKIACEISAALAAAHSAGVVHRDLKPENVMRTPAGNCKVLDFGLARLQIDAAPDSAATKSHLTSAGIVVGTVGYMAPEQLEGREVDFRCDIFGFGVLLYELAAGVHPFQSGSPASTIVSIMRAEPPPLTQRNALLPAELERIVRKCLRKRREERYQSTQDLVVDLTNLRSDSEERPSSVAAAPVAPAAEDSLLGSLFSRVGATPRRWWEIGQLLAVFVTTPIALDLALRASATISAKWNTGLASNWHGQEQMIHAIVSNPGDPYEGWRAFGLAFFLSLVLLLITSAAMRLYLLSLAVFIPGRLHAEMRKFQTVLKVIYIVVVSQFAYLGFLLLRGGELVFGAGLVAFGLLAFMAIVYVEPVIVRSAFPQAFTEAEELRARRALIYRIAAANIPYALLLIAPVAVGKIALDKVMAGISGLPTGAQLGLFAYSMVMTLGSITLCISSIRMVKEGNSGLRVYLRWFPVYLGTDYVAAGAWVWMALDGNIPAVIAVFITAVLLALPFAQLRMAKQALRDSGELTEEPPEGQVRGRRA